MHQMNNMRPHADTSVTLTYLKTAAKTKWTEYRLFTLLRCISDHGVVRQP